MQLLKKIINSIPCVVVTEGYKVPSVLFDFANENSIPLLHTRLSTMEFTHLIEL